MLLGPKQRRTNSTSDSVTFRALGNAPLTPGKLNQKITSSLFQKTFIKKDNFEKRANQRSQDQSKPARKHYRLDYNGYRREDLYESCNGEAVCLSALFLVLIHPC